LKAVGQAFNQAHNYLYPLMRNWKFTLSHASCNEPKPVSFNEELKGVSISGMFFHQKVSFNEELKDELINVQYHDSLVSFNEELKVYHFFALLIATCGYPLMRNWKFWTVAHPQKRFKYPLMRNWKFH